MDGEPLTASDMQTIANILAWSDGSLDDGISMEYGIDFDGMMRVMSRYGYEWDFDCELWVSRRDIWANWDGTLPSDGADP